MSHAILNQTSMFTSCDKDTNVYGEKLFWNALLELNVLLVLKHSIINEKKECNLSCVLCVVCFCVCKY